MPRNTFHSATLALVFFATTSTANAQESFLIASSAAPALSAASLENQELVNAQWQPIPAGTLVTIEISQALESSIQKRGDTFPIALAEPLLIDGVERLPVGTPGTGQVIHAAASRGGGAPGELMIAARTLESTDGQLLLRGFTLGGRGKDSNMAALNVSLVAGPLAMFVHGREIVIPAGTRGTAKVKANAKQPAPLSSDAIPAPPEADAQSTSLGNAMQPQLPASQPDQARLTSPNPDSPDPSKE